MSREPEVPALMRTERLSIVEFLHEIARDAMTEGDARHAEFVDGLADRIASGEHREEPEVLGTRPRVLALDCEFGEERDD